MNNETSYCIGVTELHDVLNQWLKQQLPGRSLQVSRILYGTPADGPTQQIELTHALTLMLKLEVTNESDH